MSRSVEETRRDFLVRLAKGAAFVPPALFTVDVSRVAAQGKGSGKSATTSSSSVVGTLTPTSPAAAQQQLGVELQTTTEPWDPGTTADSPPWSAPPPTSSGG